MVGKGIIGRSVTTVAGRAFGRSEQDIGYFGGYKRNKNYRKDPKRTTIGSGPITAIRVGDSSADILGKMYNFMEKTHELYKKNYAIEKSHREEQMEEDERRHKKLIEQLLKSYTKSTVKPTTEEKKEEKEPTWIDKMLDGMKTALGFILAPMFKGLKFLFNSIGTLAKGLLHIPEMLLNNSLKIFSMLAGPITGLITSIAGSLIGKALSSLISFVVGGIATLVTKIPGIAALSGFFRTGLGAALAAIGIGAAGLIGINKYEEYGEGLEIGEKAASILDQLSSLRNEYNSIKTTPWNYKEVDQQKQILKDKFNKLLAEYEKEKVKYEGEVLKPSMANLGEGWVQTGESANGPKDIEGRKVAGSGTMIIGKFLENGQVEKADTLDFVRAIKVPQMVKNAKEGVGNFISGKIEDVKKEYFPEGSESSEKLKKAQELQNELQNIINGSGTPAGDIIIKGQNNIGGSAPKIINNDVLLSRNINPTYRKTQMQLAVAV